MDITHLLDPRLIEISLIAEDPEEVLRALAALAAPAVAGAPEGSLFKWLSEREGLCSTGVGGGVAIPHCKAPDLERAILGVATLKKGIDFGALDGEKVRVFFVLISPLEPPATHLRALATVSHWLKDKEHLHSLVKAKSREAILEALGYQPPPPPAQTASSQTAPPAVPEEPVPPAGNG